MSYSLHDIVRDWQKVAIHTAPTRQCMICECIENPGAEIIDLGKTWLCDNCKTILQKIIKEKQENEKENEQTC